MSKRNRYIVFGVIAVAVVGFFVIQNNVKSVNADERLQLEITSPASRTSVTDASVVVTGIISNAAAEVSVNDEVVTVSDDGGFTYETSLDYGSNRISIRAGGEGFSSVSRTLSVPREMVLEVLAPVEDSVSDVDTITVNGTISDLDATIMVAGNPVEIAEDGTWSTELELHYPLTVINVTATREGIDPITKLITINRKPV